MADNATAALSLFEAWEKRDFEAMAAYLADGVSINDAPRGEVVSGKAAVQEWYASWAGACPDSVAGTKLVAASGDAVAVEGVWAGTNTGPFGPLPATGRTVSMPWVNVLHFDGDGRIVSGTAYYDQLTLLTQLGHLQLPA